MIHVIIVNGKPRAGKDTFIKMMSNALREQGIDVDTFSSIDPVRWMLTMAGLDLTAKTEADRKLLAVVGAELEEHCGFRTNRSYSQVEQFAAVHQRSLGVFFLHMREPALIEKMRQMLHWADLTTVFIESDRAENVTSNSADAGVQGMTYDHVLSNSGTLDDLREVARELLATIVKPLAPF